MPSTSSDHLDTSTEAESLPSSPKLISHRSEAEVMTLQNEALKDWHKGPGNIFTA